MKTLWIEEEADSTECHAWNRDTKFLVHLHFGWATEPVKWDLQKLLPDELNFPGSVTCPSNQHSFTPVSPGEVFHWYRQTPLTQMQIITYSKCQVGASSFFKRTR